MFRPVNNNTKVKLGFIEIVILLVFMIFIVSISYVKYNNTLEETTKNLNEKIISYHFETFEKLSKQFLKVTDNHFLDRVQKDKKLRKQFEDMMDLIRISTVQNFFVVAKNESDEYYFLLDSEKDPAKRSNFYEPFDPLGDVWDRCYKIKKSQIFYHNKNKNLWVTIVYPIVENNQTVALLGADISHQLDINMKKRLQDFTQFFFWLLFVSIALFVFLYILILYFRRKYYKSYADPLTEIYNRQYLYDILIKKLPSSYQLFMIDIDFFKKINDTYGHDAGDLILREVANRIKSLIREEDILIRYDGEEFLIYTTKLTPEKCFEFAERIRKKIKEKPIVYRDISCQITVSIGINPNATNRNSFSDMLIKADKALYQAKRSGRDCVKIAE